MPSIATHTLAVPSSLIRGISDLAIGMLAAGEGPINFLLAGEPTVPIAPHIGEAANAAWLRGDTKYTPNGGVLPFREAMSDFLRDRFGAEVPPARIWSTIGGTHALYQAFGLALDPGDEILVPDPGYTTFTMAAVYHAGVPVPYPLRAEADFRIELHRLEDLITPRTRAILVNSPSNPLGTVIDEAEAAGILDFARRHDLWVVSDEVYERLTWGPDHVSLTALAAGQGDDRVLGVFSFSKTFAMTGIRIGALVAPARADRELRAMQEAAISCVNEPAQFAAIAALTGPQDAVAEARELYLGNLEAGRALLEAKGLRFVDPGGAFYFWIDVSHVSGGDVNAWCQRFLREEKVAVSPGSAFGAQGEGWIRVSFAGDRESLLSGLELIPSP